MSPLKTGRSLPALLGAVALCAAFIPASAQADQQMSWRMDDSASTEVQAPPPQPPAQAQAYQSTYNYSPPQYAAQPAQQQYVPSSQQHFQTPQTRTVMPDQVAAMADQYKSAPSTSSVAPVNSGSRFMPTYLAAPQPAPQYVAPAQAQNNYDMPSYHAPLAQSPYWGLETHRGVDLGVQGFYYRYREHNLDVTNLGGKGGVLADATWTFGPGYFATVEGRFAIGTVTYHGSGTADDNLDYFWEFRPVIGRDFVMDRYSISPYFGLGYRDLYNDSRGVSTIGAHGYRRYNQLVYVPVGVHPRTHLDEHSRLTSTFEIDPIIHGWQTSKLGDGISGEPDLHNDQESGFGVRADIMYERDNWSVGPFLTYWDIDESTNKHFFSPNSVCGSHFCIGTEPENHTLEAGIQFKYHLPYHM